ncbi:MAG: hypothetical protein O2904_03685, partial [bacterium]|nr:hypothetical protein [bacterium]
MHHTPISLTELRTLTEKAKTSRLRPEVLERLAWFVHFTQFQNIQLTCDTFKIARSTFYRWFHRFDPLDLSTITNQPKSALLKEGKSPSVKHYCPLCAIWNILRGRVLYTLLGVFLVNLAILIFLLPEGAGASSFDPAMLVHSESTLTIDDGTGTSDIALHFGDSINEIFKWDILNAEFSFSDDIHTTGNISATGSLTIDGAAVFGSTVRLNGITYTFPSSDGSNTHVLTTNGAGTLSWAAAAGGGISEANADERYVQVAGDTMTGGLAIHASAGLASTGSIITEGNFTLNSDNAAQDAVVTFGNDAAAETFKFTNTNERFEFSDDVHVTGKLTASGALNVTGDSVVHGEMIIQNTSATIRLGDATSNLGIFESNNGMTIRSPEAAVIAIDSNSNDSTSYFAVIANNSNTYGNSSAKPT